MSAWSAWSLADDADDAAAKLHEYFAVFNEKDGIRVAHEIYATPVPVDGRSPDLQQGDYMNTRREFIAASAGIAALGLLDSEQSSGQSSEGLEILVLGGTGFIGPHFVRHAVARGHKISLFNRGRTNTHLFPETEKLLGDRNDNLRTLEGRRWDAVLDNSGYTPLQVRQSVDLLKNNCDQYLFTSTRAVYTDFTHAVMDEDAPVGPQDLPESEWSGYGPNKVLAERIVQAAFGARTLITRPPVIVGPGDRTDRFTYWVDRLDDGGEILVQGHHADPIQFVEVRDLAEFYVHLLENATTGIFNTEGPQSELDTAGLVHGIRAISSTASSLNWVPWDFLVEQGEVPQDTVVFWNRPSGRYLNYGRMVNTRAINKGMKFRPLASIAQDTLAWHRTRPIAAQTTLRAGLTRDREKELLRLYRNL